MTDYFRYKSYPPVQIEESGNTYTYFPFLYENEGSRKTCYFIVYCIDEDYNRVDTSSVVFDFGDGASSYATDAFVFVGRKDLTAATVFMSSSITVRYTAWTLPGN